MKSIREVAGVKVNKFIMTVALAGLMSGSAWAKWTYYKVGDELPDGTKATYAFMTDGDWVLKASMRGASAPTIEQYPEDGVLDLSTVWDDITNEDDYWKDMWFNQARFAIKNCSQLKKLILPSSGMTTYGNSIFSGNTELLEIAGTACVTNIKYNVFQGCTKLTTISATFDEVQVIGQYAFSDNPVLTGDLSFPALETLANYAFYNPNKAKSCKVTSFSAPKCVTVGQSAFYGDEDLTNVVVSPEITSLADQSFGYCYGLKHFSPEIAPKTLELENFIGAFTRCTNLNQRLTLHRATADNFDFTSRPPWSRAGFTEIDMSNCAGTFTWSDAFAYCASIEKIWFPPNQTLYAANALQTTAPDLRVYLTGLKPTSQFSSWFGERTSYSFRIYYDPKMDSAWKTSFAELTALTDDERARADFPSDLEPGQVVTGTWTLGEIKGWCIKYRSPLRKPQGMMMILR